ncbi:MAG: enoyl-CoA hydratase/isomerase family protein [Acidobacteria bacterium]|nr:enoyl-CoA hydratase/isomerase family protein [Acidobacteriota bacterium]
MGFDNLLVERDGPVVTITISRPKVLNALNAQTLDELEQAVRDVQQDVAIRVVILTGAGEKAFVAGADISELGEQRPESARAMAARGQRLFRLIETLGKPVIAAINGYALGGGCELAMACTLRLAADTAKLGLPEITLGLLPGYGGTQRLPRLVGRGRALELMLTGAAIPANEAHRIGLVNRVVPADALMAEARALAAHLAAQAPIATAYILDAVDASGQMTLAEGCRHEAALFGLAAATEDMREGTRAFLDKRKPTFKGQ